MRLLFSPSVAFRVYDEFERATIERQPDGGMLVSVQLPFDSWVIGYLLSFGTEVSVLEPASLQRQIAAYAEAIWRHHQKNIVKDEQT